MITAKNLRKVGLLETLAFRFSDDIGRWNCGRRNGAPARGFDYTYKYYTRMTEKFLWRSL